jgi:hypothetical protein
MEYLECMHANNETKANDVQNTAQKELVVLDGTLEFKRHNLG